MRFRRTAQETVFSVDDLSVLILLVGGLDPDGYTRPEAKSLIYKCRSAVTRVDDATSLVGPVRVRS